MQNKVVKTGVHLVHQFGCSDAKKDPPGICSLQGTIEGNVCKEITGMHGKIKTTHNEVAHLVKRIHHCYGCRWLLHSKFELLLKLLDFPDSSSKSQLS